MHWPHFAEVIWEIKAAIVRIEERLGHNTQRLDRIEDRLHKVEIREPFKPADLLPWLYGLIILGSVLLGKLSVVDALGLIQSQR